MRLPLLLTALLPVLAAAEAPSSAPRPLQGLTTAQAQMLIQAQSSPVGRVVGGQLPLVDRVTVRLLSDPEFLPRMARLGGDRRRARWTLLWTLVWGAALCAGAILLWRRGSTRRKVFAVLVVWLGFPLGFGAIVAAFYYRDFALLFRLVREALGPVLSGS